MKKQLKNILFITSMLAFGANFQLFSQTKPNICGPNVRKNAGIIDTNLVNRKMNQLRVSATTPYIIKLFFVVFSEDDGELRAAEDADIYKEVVLMSNNFSPHNICFIVGGIQEVRSTNLNRQDASEEADLEQYLKPNFITVFVHRELADGTQILDGTSYAIPNSYLSIRGSAFWIEKYSGSLAHEMGHCFGLYHTFEEDFAGKENVKRSASSCVNCETAGDLLCDTPADLKYYDYNVDANCNVLDNGVTDDCDQSSYTFPTQNVMSYGDFMCHNQFTAGQGNRARSFIITTNFLENAIAIDDATYSNPINYTSGIRTLVARNFISIENTIIVSQSAQFQASAKEIVIKAGANFTPNADGFTVLLSNPFCN